MQTRLRTTPSALALAAATLFALAASPAGATSFSGNDMNLVGAASMQGSDLQLTTATGSNEVGAAWLLAPLSTAQSFSATFSFSLAQSGSDPMADGIVFALQNLGSGAIGYSGGNLGYYGLGGVGSVIQTYTNNRVGLNTDGNPYNSPQIGADLGHASLVTGSETVAYNAGTHVLSMNGQFWVDGLLATAHDSTVIDLGAKFGPTMVAGFTGGSGGAYADQRITGFSIAAVPEPQTHALLLAGLGSMAFIARRRARAAGLK